MPDGPNPGQSYESWIESMAGASPPDCDDVPYQVLAACPTCKGSGLVGELQDCGDCAGSGVVGEWPQPKEDESDA